ncbi:MAG: hypothetical protein Q8T09_23800 [Candidatus Melainabacteria bacterium]|nr:hypothetical protein [Candidatus Melainabacteria bacterium]
MESSRSCATFSFAAALATAQLILLTSFLPAATAAAPSTSPSNTVEVPKQILRTGINLDARTVSPNTLQLAQNLNLLPVLSRLQELRARVAQHQSGNTLESLSDRQELLEVTQKAQNILIRTSLEIDFVCAEIGAEQNIYSEVLSSLQGSRDKLVTRINAGSFILNGALWTVCEALAIVSPLHPNYAIQSGIVGIAAGIVPSIASGYALKAYSGKHLKSECEPNMLAKIFNRPINQDIDYPKSVWSFLNTAPASDIGSNAGKTRKEQLIARWVSDKNIPSFTDKSNTKEIDIITATNAQKKGLSIDHLNVRMVMLDQLQGELAKMKRLLMEIAMVITDEKEV